MSETITIVNDVEEWEAEMDSVLIPLGAQATGTIEPKIGLTLYRRLIEELGGDELYQKAEGSIIAKCIDGRNCRHASCYPNSAGGTLGIAVARDVLDQHEGALGFDTIFEQITIECEAHDVACGGHEAVGGEGDHTGCGASDKLADIYQKMLTEHSAIQSLVQSLGVDVSAHDMILEGISRRVGFSEYGSAGTRKRTVAEHGIVETLEGSHNEAVIVINMRAGTTLDRDALSREYGEDVQVFNVDAWAFEPTARTFAMNPDDETEVAAIIAALAYFNLAAAMVLCGPAMSIIVRQ